MKTKTKNIDWRDKKIVITDGGCSIIGDGWDLTLPSTIENKIREKYSNDSKKLEKN